MRKTLSLLLLLLPLQAGCTHMLDRFNAEGAEADMRKLLVQHDVEVTEIHCDMAPSSRNFTCHFSVKQYPKGTLNTPKPTGTLNKTMRLQTYSTKTFLSNTEKSGSEKKEFIDRCYPFHNTLAEFDGQVLGTTMPRQPEAKVGASQFSYLFIHFASFGEGCLTSSYSFG
jgi:hypothetical protein